MPAGAATASRPPNARNSAGCVVRSGICVRSVRSSARPRFSSPGRPVTGELLPADRRGERTPPGLPARPCAGCVARGRLRLGVASAVAADADRRRPHPAGPDHPRSQPWDLRRAARACRAAPRLGPPRRPQAGRPPDARPRPAGHPPPPAAGHHATRPAGVTSSRSCRAEPHAGRSGPVWVADITQQRTGEGWLPGGDPGRVLAPGRGLVDGRPPGHRAGPGRPRHGHQPAATSTWPGLSLRPRLPGHLIRLRPPPGRLPTRRLDGDRRGRTRQRGRRELLRHPGMRAPRPLSLADQIRTADGDLRLHRGLLQPPTPPLDPRLPPTRRLRAPPRINSTRDLTTVSTETGQLHLRRDETTAVLLWSLLIPSGCRAGAGDPERPALASSDR